MENSGPQTFCPELESTPELLVLPRDRRCEAFQLLYSIPRNQRIEVFRSAALPGLGFAGSSRAGCFEGPLDRSLSGLFRHIPGLPAHDHPRQSVAPAPRGKPPVTAGAAD